MPKFQCPFKKVFNHSYVISKEKPNDFASLAYQKTVDNVMYANVDQKYQVISVIPTMKNDVLANLVANLGYLIATKQKKVLLIDLDFRNPRLHVVLKSEMQKGIYDYLFKNLDFKEVIQKDKEYGFDYLLIGEAISSITQILESNKLNEMIKLAKEAYDYVLLISPSVAFHKDYLSIAKLSDGILYIISKKYSNKQVVDSNFRNLKQLNIPILGSLLIDYKEREKILGIPLL